MLLIAYGFPINLNTPILLQSPKTWVTWPTKNLPHPIFSPLISYSLLERSVLVRGNYHIAFKLKRICNLNPCLKIQTKRNLRNPNYSKSEVQVSVCVCMYTVKFVKSI